MLTFDEWWASYWPQTQLPGVMNMAFREIAQNAWNAAYQQALIDQKCKVDFYFPVSNFDFQD